MDYTEIKSLITAYKNKVQLKLSSKDFAKGYCYCALALSDKISSDEFDELSRMVDDAFN